MSGEAFISRAGRLWFKSRSDQSDTMVPTAGRRCDARTHNDAETGPANESFMLRRNTASTMKDFILNTVLNTTLF